MKLLLRRTLQLLVHASTLNETVMENKEQHHQQSPSGEAAEKELRIFLIGFMGCGKSYWGRQLAQKLELPFFDLDHAIEEGEERPITAIFEEEGEEHFRQLEKETLHL